MIKKNTFAFILIIGLMIPLSAYCSSDNAVPFDEQYPAPVEKSTYKGKEFIQPSGDFLTTWNIINKHMDSDVKVNASSDDDVIRIDGNNVDIPDDIDATVKSSDEPGSTLSRRITMTDGDENIACMMLSTIEYSCVEI